jgi:hypothetical protein
MEKIYSQEERNREFYEKVVMPALLPGDFKSSDLSYEEVLQRYRDRKKE